MDIRDRVMPSDWVTGIGALILFISIFLSWYSYEGIGGSGWDATKLTIIPLLCSLAAIAIVVLRIVDVDMSAIPVPMAFIVIGLGGLSTLIVLIRLLIKPSIGVGPVKFTPGLSYGIFISLLAAIAVLVGGILMQREEMYY